MKAILYAMEWVFLIAVILLVHSLPVVLAVVGATMVIDYKRNWKGM